MCADYSYRINNGVYHAIFRLIFISTVTTILLLLYISTKHLIQTDRLSMKTENNTQNISKLFSFISTVNQSIFHRDSCRIEVFGGFEGLEQIYISGTLFVVIYNERLIKTSPPLCPEGVAR